MDQTTLILTIAGIILGPLTVFSGFIYWQRRRLRNTYEFIWKKSKRFKPDQLLKERIKFYQEYYYQRQIDNRIAEAIDNGKNVLVVGRPLSGKTRAIFQFFRTARKSFSVLVPHHRDIDTLHFKIPKRFAWWPRRILFLDDLQIYVAQKDFDHLLRLGEKKCILVATCRSHEEFDRVKDYLQNKNLSLEAIFPRKYHIEVEPVDQSTAKEITKKLGRTLNQKTFDRTIGSLFMPFEEMQKRFRDCSPNEKCILRSLKKMYMCCLWEPDYSYDIEIMKTFAKAHGAFRNDAEVDVYLGNLKAKDFVREFSATIQIEEAYFATDVAFMVVDFTATTTLQDIFTEILELWRDKPDDLFRLANKINENIKYRLDFVVYNKFVVKALTTILQRHTLESFPIHYAMTQNNLGTVYRTLSEVEDKVENSRRAISAYEESLKVYTLKSFRMDYAMTQNNLGTAYSMLSEVEDKLENCRVAISAYKEALKVRTLESFPIQYAMTQNNLGNAYRTLSEVKDKVENSRRAISAYKESLKVRTLESFPIQYAMTQNNLGTVYRTLSEVEDKVKNSRRAISAYKEALKVRTLESFPMDYAMTQNNLGIAYSSLSEVEDKVENSRLAIASYEEALKVFTEDEFPYQYRAVTGNVNILVETNPDIFAEDTGEN